MGAPRAAAPRSSYAKKKEKKKKVALAAGQHDTQLTLTPVPKENGTLTAATELLKREKKEREDLVLELALLQAYYTQLQFGRVPP
jgi:hypothetical protein